MISIRKWKWIVGVVGSFGLALPLTPAGAALADSSKLIFVKVVNGARNPVLVRDVDQPARQIFRTLLNCTVTQGELTCEDRVVVPPGKLLVIETMSGFVVLPGGQQPSVSCVVGSFPPEFGFGLPLERTVTFTTMPATDFFGALAPVRLYASQGEQVRLFFIRDQVNSGGTASLVLSGYLVDCGAEPGCPLP